jgi:hypothetical protein
MSNQENRIYQRVQCFNLPFEREFIPIWVFNPGGGPAGLVVNLSLSGVQVLTDAREPLTEHLYEIAFLADDKSDVSTAPSCQMTRVWSDENSTLYTKSGFTFMGEPVEIIKFQIERMDSGIHHYLRCGLREVID